MLFPTIFVGAVRPRSLCFEEAHGLEFRLASRCQQSRGAASSGSYSRAFSRIHACARCVRSVRCRTRGENFPGLLAGFPHGGPLPSENSIIDESGRSRKFQAASHFEVAFSGKGLTDPVSVCVLKFTEITLRSRAFIYIQYVQ